MSSREEIDAVGAASDPEPQPSDGPDYHAEHALWAARQPASDNERELIRLRNENKRYGEMVDRAHDQRDALLSRLPPLTREALREVVYGEFRVGPVADRITNAILSRLSVPEPAEVEYEYAWEADEAVRQTMNPRGPRILMDGYPHTPEELARFPRGRRVKRVKASAWVDAEEDE